MFLRELPQARARGVSFAENLRQACLCFRVIKPGQVPCVRHNLRAAIGMDGAISFARGAGPKVFLVTSHQQRR